MRGFQSTHPGRSATSPRPFFNVALLVSIHAPRVGCDIYLQLVRLAVSCFNPRTPGGVRLQCFVSVVQLLSVSIHAPRAGCDTICRSAIRNYSRFQSTHPARGATSKTSTEFPTDSVSIHAPRPGCDSPSPTRPFLKNGFNPRTPPGVRQNSTQTNLQVFPFQSTHPARGATGLLL